MISDANKMCDNDGVLDKAQPSDVSIFEINSIEELKQFIASTDIERITDKKYCLFKNSNEKFFRFNESVIRNFIDKDYDVITLNSVLRYWKNTKGQYIESRRSSDAPNGQTLSAQNDETLTNNIGFLRSTFIGVSKEDTWYPLMNILIKTRRISEIIKDYLSGDLFVNNNYSVCNTKMFTNVIDIFFEKIIPTDLHDEKIGLIINKADAGYKVAIYGFGGYLYKKICRALINRGRMDNIFLVDREMQGQNHSLEHNGVILKAQVYGYNDIKTGIIEPDIIVVASMFSYKQIITGLKNYGTRSLILPLADLRDIRWMFL